MTYRFAALALLLAALPVRAAPPPAPVPAKAHVALTTTLGPIILELDGKDAPVTTANFLRYVAEKRFDGTAFYRASMTGPDYGLIQGGTRNAFNRVLPPIAHEPTTRTGLHHVTGTISMARETPGTATGDFFITLGTIPSMDADAKDAGFAAFGHVSQGLDVVRMISKQKTSSTLGVGPMKGQMLAEPVRIVTARRTD